MSSFPHLKGEFKWQRKPGCWSLAGGDLLINTLSVCPKERHTLSYYLHQRARQKASQEAGADVNFSGGENEDVRFFSSKPLKSTGFEVEETSRHTAGLGSDGQTAEAQIQAKSWVESETS